MSKSNHSSIQPKSIRQKQILDIAAEDPKATLAEIADEVPSASADHVDRVLNQYGDPAATGTENAGGSVDSNEDAGKHGSDDGRGDVGGHEDAESHDAADHKDAATDDDASSAPDAEDGRVEASEQAGGSDVSDRDEDRVSVEPSAGSDLRTGDDEPVSAGEDGPPAENGGAETDAEGERIERADAPSETAAEETPPDPDDLTQKERETLRAIHYEPNATQKQIAEMLGVSRATVSNRVNAIRGFDWADRQAFVDEVFDGELTVEGHGTDDAANTAADTQGAERRALPDGAAGTNAGGASLDSNLTPNPDPADGGDGPRRAAPGSSPSRSTGRDERGDGDAPPGGTEPVAHEIRAVSDRLATIEREVTGSDTADGDDPFADTELVHKVIYACMNSDRVSEEEELRILEGLID